MKEVNEKGSMKHSVLAGVTLMLFAALLFAQVPIDKWGKVPVSVVNTPTATMWLPSASMTSTLTPVGQTPTLTPTPQHVSVDVMPTPYTTIVTNVEVRNPPTPNGTAVQNIAINQSVTVVGGPTPNTTTTMPSRMMLTPVAGTGYINGVLSIIYTSPTGYMTELQFDIINNTANSVGVSLLWSSAGATPVPIAPHYKALAAGESFSNDRFYLANGSSLWAVLPQPSATNTIAVPYVYRGREN